MGAAARWCLLSYLRPQGSPTLFAMVMDRAEAPFKVLSLSPTFAAALYRSGYSPMIIRKRSNSRAHTLPDREVVFIGHQASG